MFFQNLREAHQKIQKALERYDSMLPSCSTHLDADKREALEKLSDALSNVLAACNTSTPFSYDELEKEVLSKITAAKEACEIEDSEEVTQITNVEELFEEQEDEESNLHKQLLARSAQHLEDCQKIKNKILSDIIPFNHYDPAHPIVIVNTAVTDGVQFPIFLPWAFDMKRSDCVKAGLAANLVSSIVTSPYLQSRALAHLPRCTHIVKLLRNYREERRNF